MNGNIVFLDIDGDFEIVIASPYKFWDGTTCLPADAGGVNGCPSAKPYQKDHTDGLTYCAESCPPNRVSGPPELDSLIFVTNGSTVCASSCSGGEFSKHSDGANHLICTACSGGVEHKRYLPAG
jgi:hypothetical protein